MKQDLMQLEELAQLMERYGISKLEVSEERILMERNGAPLPQTAVAAAAEKPAQVQEKPKMAEPVMQDYKEIVSPLVGTVYLAPEAGAAPFVQVGDTISEGQPVCIVESMKMFNQITADCSGVVAEVCVENGQIAEYGQALFRIKQTGGEQ